MGLVAEESGAAGGVGVGVTAGVTAAVLTLALAALLVWLWWRHWTLPKCPSEGAVGLYVTTLALTQIRSQTCCCC